MSAGDHVELGLQVRNEVGLLDAISAAVIATDLDGTIFYWNKAAEDLYGYSREQMLGASVTDLLVRSDEHDLAADIMRRVTAGRRWTGEFPVRAADGRTIRVRITNSPLVVDGRVVGVVGVAEDIAEMRAARAAAQLLSDRLTQLAKVTAELGTAPSVEAVSEVIVSHAADAVGAVVSVLAVRVDADTLAIVGRRGMPERLGEEWGTIPLTAPLAITEAVRTGTPVVVDADEIKERFPHSPGAELGDAAAVALPLSLGDRVVGGILLTFRGRHAPDEREMEFLATAADACAQALGRIRATEAAADQATKLGFLATASAELSSSLDYQTTLTKVAKLTVPILADWCAVEVVEDGRLRTLAVAHVDPEKVELAEELQRRYPSDPQAATGAPNVVRSGVSELYPDISDEMLVAGTRDEEHLRLARELQLRSAICVPLTARGRVLGAFTLVSAESGRRYDADDLAFAEEVARRAAVAIDNAHLHSETRDAAVRLQRAVLPQAPLQVSGWDIAAHYAPAGRTEVGGDFYDTVPLDDGRIAVLVGDVMGRGVAAAAAMSQVRAAMRAYIAVDPDPALVLGKLDRMFAMYDTSQLVTLVYLVCDPATDTAVGVNAGHPPAVVVRASGTVEPAALSRGVPLGVGPEDRSATSVELFAGDTLLLYSDGLVERRGEDIDVGLARLETAAAGLADGPIDEQLERVVSGILDGERDDDVTALAVRRARV